MPPTPQSHAEINCALARDDQAQRIGYLQDELARRAHPAGALPTVCFTALSASAGMNCDGPVLTFATDNGKSLQISLRLPSDKSRALLAEIMGLFRVRKPYAHYSR